VAEASDVVFTSVPDGDMLETSASGPNGRPRRARRRENLGRREHRQPAGTPSSPGQLETNYGLTGVADALRQTNMCRHGLLMADSRSSSYRQ